MSALTDAHAWIDANLADLITTHGVPAASVGVLCDGEIVTGSAGVLNLGTGVEATDEAIFQIGSITKVWTATLIMQLVDEGLLDLDAPVRTYLPELTTTDPEAAAGITSRQLLCHTAGFEGDAFTDTGRGDDCVEKFVAGLGEIPQIFPPGTLFSYNNAGFVVLGRIIEVLRGVPYDAALRAHLIEPLALEHAATNADEAVRERTAIGHLPTGEEQALAPAASWGLPRSNGPVGAQLSMTARDLLRFAQAHLAGGVAPGGTRILSEESAAAMLAPQTAIPDLGIGDAWGLGWMLWNWDGTQIVFHDGGTFGQYAFLRIAPEHGAAVAVLTNGGGAREVFAEILDNVFRPIIGVTQPPFPTPADGQVDVDLDYVRGTYSSSVNDFTIRTDDEDRIWLDIALKGIVAELGETFEPMELVGWRGTTLLTKEPHKGVHLPFALIGDDGQGRAAFLHSGRADRRAES